MPPATFDFRFIELSGGPSDAIALECTVTGVYPRPVLAFTETTSSNASYRHRAPPVNVTVLATTTTTPEIDGDNDDNDVNEAENQESRRRFPSSPRYSASFRYPVQSVLSAGTVYECRLALPGTSYARKKRIKIIFPTSEYLSLFTFYTHVSFACLMITFHHHLIMTSDRGVLVLLVIR